MNLDTSKKVVQILCWQLESTIYLSQNQQFHNQTKNIDIKFFFAWDEIEKGKVEVIKIHTYENVLDMLTKPVAKQNLQYCLGLIGFTLPEKG